jgi:hypothetical protein
MTAAAAIRAASSLFRCKKFFSQETQQRLQNKIPEEKLTFANPPGNG